MEDLTAKYPYYVVALLEDYNNSKRGSDSRRLLRARILANIGDREVAERLVPPEKDDEDKKMEEKGAFDPIDSFLSKFGHDHKPLGYMKDLVEEESHKEEKQPVYSERESEKLPVREEEKKEEKNQPSLSELIKNRRYSEALAIIELQNLNNPEKNIYFADQIRFIKKLIAIETYKTKPKG